MKKLTLFVILSLFSFLVNAQIGLTQKQISSADSLFLTCDEYKDCTFIELKSGTGIVFNFEDSICISVTVYSKPDSKDYINLITLFGRYTKEIWSSQLKLSDSKESLIFTMKKVSLQ